MTAATIRATSEGYSAAFTNRYRAACLDLFADGPRIEDPLGAPRMQRMEPVGGYFDNTTNMASAAELGPTRPIRAADEAVFVMQSGPAIGRPHLMVDSSTSSTS